MSQSTFFISIKHVPDFILKTVKRSGIIPTICIPRVPKSSDEFISQIIIDSSRFDDVFFNRPSKLDNINHLISYPKITKKGEGIDLELKLINECSTWFAFAVDDKFKELTDCGGFKERNEKIEDAAIRELYEESAGLFDFRSVQWRYVISNLTPVIISEGICIFFPQIKTPCYYGFPFDLPHDFLNNKICIHANGVENVTNKRKMSKLENYTMYWISLNEVVDLIQCKTKKRKPKETTSPYHNFHYSKINGRLVPEHVSSEQKHPVIYEKIRNLLCNNIVDLENYFQK